MNVLNSPKKIIPRCKILTKYWWTKQFQQVDISVSSISSKGGSVILVNCFKIQVWHPFKTQTFCYVNKKSFYPSFYLKLTFQSGLVSFICLITVAFRKYGPGSRKGQFQGKLLTIKNFRGKAPGYPKFSGIKLGKFSGGSNIAIYQGKKIKYR